MVKDIRNYTLECCGQNGHCTQETFLFNTSIKHNIAYGLEDYPIEKVIEAAKPRMHTSLYADAQG